MKLIQATTDHVSLYAGEIADLMHATGPITYDYQFNGRSVFDLMIAASWPVAGTLFGFDGFTLALEDNELLGVEVGFPGPEFDARKKALAPLWSPLLESGQVARGQLADISERTYLASYLNVSIPKRVYYIHALAVKTSCRGRGIGAALVNDAIKRDDTNALRGLHLDVLSDNPAVAFYRALGLTCLAETTAPGPSAHGVPMEMRMAVDFPR
jgi:ribosomal protein S18 acetylase RimI-like enzyme